MDDHRERKASHAAWWKVVQVLSLQLDKHLSKESCEFIHDVNARWLLTLNITPGDRLFVDEIFEALWDVYPEDAPKSYEEYCG